MRILLLFILSFIISYSFAQSKSKMASSKALPWIHGDLPPDANRIKYKVVFGDGEQLSDAQKNAIRSLLFDLGAEKGVTISSKTIIQVEEKVLNKRKTIINSNYLDQISIDQDGFNATFYKVDEYYEKARQLDGKIIYRCWQLYAIGNNLANQIKSLEYSTKYGVNAGLRSLVIPGWGQLFKKDNTKGIIHLSLEAIAIGGIIYEQSRYNYNINRMEESISLDIQKEYKKRAEDNLLYRNLSIGVAIANALWSTIDALATDGAPRYAVGNNKLQFRFVSCPDAKWALGIQYHF